MRVIAAGPAGATADLIARLVTEPLAKELGQTAIVDPKPGAAGAIAVNDLLQSPHDGHTLLVGVNSLVSEIPHIVKLQRRHAASAAAAGRAGARRPGAGGQPELPGQESEGADRPREGQPGQGQLSRRTARAR